MATTSWSDAPAYSKVEPAIREMVENVVVEEPTLIPPPALMLRAELHVIWIPLSLKMPF